MEGQGHFWPWPQGIYIWKLKLGFLINYWAIFNQILYKEMKINEHDAGHMTKMATTPMYVKILQKSSPDSVNRFSLTLVCNIGDSSPS